MSIIYWQKHNFHTFINKCHFCKYMKITTLLMFLLLSLWLFLQLLTSFFIIAKITCAFHISKLYNDKILIDRILSFCAFSFYTLSVYWKNETNTKVQNFAILRTELLRIPNHVKLSFIHILLSTCLHIYIHHIWKKVFKNGPSKICERQPLINLLKQTISLQIF